MMRNVNYLRLLILISVIAALVVLVFKITKQDEPKNLGPIVFFGDSITAGLGVERGEDFPSIIGKQLGVEIINAGVSGDTTRDALIRIEEDVISKNPSIVVVEFGGNDFLQQVPFEQTEKNFEQIIRRLSEGTSARLVLVTVRTDLLRDSNEKLQQGLAQRYNAIFVPNIMKGIIGNTDLMVDQIHPNSEGHQKIAEKLIRVLKDEI